MQIGHSFGKLRDIHCIISYLAAPKSFKLTEVDTLFDFAPQFDRDALRERLRSFARRGIYLGGSSWKYEGWIGQIYSRSRYLTRGRFSKTLFQDTCLEEYATLFPTVCGDFAFYQFPPDSMWAKLFRQTPEEFRWGLKVPEQITVPVWPIHPRYGALAGRSNPTFLDARLLEEAFLRPLTPFRAKIGVLIFEFGQAAPNAFDDPVHFLKALDAFLSALPSGWRYAVEVRTAAVFGEDYFSCLAAHNVAHVFNSWTRMPPVGEQFARKTALTSDMIVTRALLKPGRAYEDAVQAFSPYERIGEVIPDVRNDLREILDFATADGRPAFIFVNNRLEGNSPMTIAALVNEQEEAHQPNSLVHDSSAPRVPQPACRKA